MSGEIQNVERASTAPEPHPGLGYLTRSPGWICGASWLSKDPDTLQVLSVRVEDRKDKAAACGDRSVRYPAEYLNPEVVRSLWEE